MYQIFNSSYLCEVIRNRYFECGTCMCWGWVVVKDPVNVNCRILIFVNKEGVKYFKQIYSLKQPLGS